MVDREAVRAMGVLSVLSLAILFIAVPKHVYSSFSSAFQRREQTVYRTEYQTEYRSERAPTPVITQDGILEENFSGRQYTQYLETLVSASFDTSFTTEMYFVAVSGAKKQFPETSFVEDIVEMVYTLGLEKIREEDNFVRKQCIGYDIVIKTQQFYPQSTKEVKDATHNFAEEAYRYALELRKETSQSLAWFLLGERVSEKYDLKIYAPVREIVEQVYFSVIQSRNFQSDTHHGFPRYIAIVDALAANHNIDVTLYADLMVRYAFLDAQRLYKINNPSEGRRVFYQGFSIARAHNLDGSLIWKEMNGQGKE